MPVAAAASAWHATPAAEVLQRLDVEAAQGLTAAEAAQRLDRDGPNRLAEAKREPR
jgi:hypothetical protein